MGKETTLYASRLMPEHAQAYRDLRLAALRTDPSSFGATLDTEAALTTAAFVQRLSCDGVFGGWYAGQLSGLTQVSVCHPGNNRHKAHLGGMYVAPNARGTGLARMLLNAALVWASENVEEVLLGVVSTNMAALHLYSTAGFRRYGVEPRAIKHAGCYHDVILMNLSLYRPSQTGVDEVEAYVPQPMVAYEDDEGAPVKAERCQATS